MKLVHFLLVYDHRARGLVEQQPFLDADEAVAAYGALEERHRYDEGLEIVLVSAESIDIIKRTHGHYFASPGEPLRMPLEMPAGLAIR